MRCCMAGSILVFGRRRRDYARSCCRGDGANRVFLAIVIFMFNDYAITSRVPQRQIYLNRPIFVGIVVYISDVIIQIVELVILARLAW